MAGLEAIATERLRGERLGPRHVDVLLPIFADPRVGETMGGVSDRERVEREAAGIDSHWEEHGFGYWLWFETATGEPVARGGLSRTEFDGRPELEVGWTTAPERWGEGFATELGPACVDHGPTFSMQSLMRLREFSRVADTLHSRIRKLAGETRRCRDGSSRRAGPHRAS
jgi:hypothetical protein